MNNKSRESVFQGDMIKQLVANGWLLGKPENYNRELALYEEDLLGFVKETQDSQWQKYCKLYPNNPEQKFLERVGSQLNKADPNAANKEMRTFGTLGVLRHELRDRGTRFSLCQFKPEHDLNPDTLARYQKNRLRVVPELVYSPWVGEEHLAQTGAKAKARRISGEEHLAQDGTKAKARRIPGEEHLAQTGAKAKAWRIEMIRIIVPSI